MRDLNILVGGMLLLSVVAHAGDIATPNILMIAIDDLRPELKCYGAEHMITPNIDKLAGQGVQFDRAYCQSAACTASRVSAMSEVRPDTSTCYSLKDDFAIRCQVLSTFSSNWANMDMPRLVLERCCIRKSRRPGRNGAKDLRV
ncbi:hypothetical protein BVY04_02755 [bacterium M21]|nr:hypothetical protein BVY04_02755 [bacterium M21]